MKIFQDATKYRLYARHCIANPNCGLCGNAEETTCHALFLCPLTKGVWQGRNLDAMVDEAPMVNFPNTLEWVFDHLDQRESISFITMAWATWSLRNSLLFEAEPRPPITIALGLTRLVEDYREYMNNINGVPVTKGNRTDLSTWAAPPAGWVKLNVDAALVEEDEVGLGFVIRNDRGVMVQAGSRRVKACWPVEVAEAKAVCFGLEKALSSGTQKIIVESDSLGVMQKIEQRNELRSPIGICVNDIFMLLSQFMIARCRHTRRGGNTVAHWLARLCATVDTEIVMCSDFPQTLIELTGLDLI